MSATSKGRVLKSLTHGGWLSRDSRGPTVSLQAVCGRANLDNKREVARLLDYCTGRLLFPSRLKQLLFGPPGEKRRHPFAKATYTAPLENLLAASRLKWRGYEPTREVSTIEEFIALVQEDRYACFFG